MFEFPWNSHTEPTVYKGYFYIHAFPERPGSNELICNGSLYGCREYFVMEYRRRIKASKHNFRGGRKAYALVTFGINSNEEWVSDLQRCSEQSLYIVNSFEKAHGWPLTKLYVPKCTNRKMSAMFFVGPRKWTTSPYLLSIWTLAIRLGRGGWLPKKLFELDHKELVTKLYNYSANSTAKHGDARQLKRTVKEWDLFMSLYEDLFSDQTRKYHWENNHVGRNYIIRAEGIIKLISGTTGYDELYDKYFKLREAKKLNEKETL